MKYTTSLLSSFFIFLISSAHAQTAISGAMAAMVAAAPGCAINFQFTDPNNPQTWTPIYGADCTSAQQTAANTALSNFNATAYLTQLANAATLTQKLAAGAVVSSTAYPSLDGIYSIDAAHEQEIMAISEYIAINGKFPAQQTTLPWLDSNGVAHNFPTTAEFLAFATAIADYVTTLNIAAQQTTPSWPSSNAVSIP